MARPTKKTRPGRATTSTPRFESRLLRDSGAIVALERGDARTCDRVRAAVQAGIRIAVPTAVVAETWRGGARSARASALLAGDSCDVEDLTQVLARATGTALGLVRGAGAVDAMVMAHAAVRGDVVMTADERDLDRLRQCDALRAVRLLKV